MKKIYENICKVEVWIVMASLAILTALVFLSAIARCFHYPIAWAVDVATFFFAWCVFLGGDIAMRSDKLVSIDVLTCRLPKNVQKYLQVTNYVIIGVFLAFLIGYGLMLSYTTRLRTFQGLPSFSYTWVTLSVPVGCILMLVSAIRKIKILFSKTNTGEQIKQEGTVTELI